MRRVRVLRNNWLRIDCSNVIGVSHNEMLKRSLQLATPSVLKEYELFCMLQILQNDTRLSNDKIGEMVRDFSVFLKWVSAPCVLSGPDFEKLKLWCHSIIWFNLSGLIP